MSDPRASGVSPGVAVVFGGVGYLALLIAGFGLLSLLSDAEVLAVPGLGQAPGALGVAASVAGFTITTVVALRRPRPSYGAAALIVVTAFLAYLAGLLAGAVFAGVDAARAVAALGGFATSWFAVVLAAAALVAGWSAVALVRTRAARPRWPWEDDADAP